MTKVIVVGGGASGMMAAVVSASKGNKTVLLERNEKLGKKIYITGKGRCNLTNTAEKDEFFNNIFVGKKFAYSCVYDFDSEMLLSMLKEAGLNTVEERGGRVFPASNKASDVTKALSGLLKKYGVEVMLDSYVKNISVKDGVVNGVILYDGAILTAEKVILCCGGKSYPSTGSDGSGYDMACGLGHTVEKLSPALTSINVKEKWVIDLAGLSLKNVTATLYENNKKVASQFGEMLFTHSGISGPIILSLSCLVNDPSRCRVELDLKPALEADVLDKRILRDFDEMNNKVFSNSLNKLLPKSLAECMVSISKIDPNKKVNQITAVERRELVALFKALPLNVTELGSFKEAIITKGGVSLKEINPSTMESKIIKGLYFAGEVINMHGYTGGFNLQLAFSSGHLAGMNV